ncbi:MAG: SLOG family protein [Eubacteriales bacterium]
MRVAVIGSRDISPELYYLVENSIPSNCTEIVSGGAVGVDKMAERYASEHGLYLKIFMPDYELYGKRAPLVRNEQIIDYAQYVLAFWDGMSHGTAYTVTLCVDKGKPVKVIRI